MILYLPGRTIRFRTMKKQGLENQLIALVCEFCFVYLFESTNQ